MLAKLRTSAITTMERPQSGISRIATAILMLPVVFSYDFSRILRNPATEVGEAVAHATTQIDTSIRNETHLGFDTYAYPGDEAMMAWRHESVPYEWVGFYLPSPCHRSDSWSGKRATLTDMGWGLAVVYVGQQVWGNAPRRKIVTTKYVTRKVNVTSQSHGKRVTRYVKKRVPVKVATFVRAEKGSSCSTRLVSRARGARDAADAVQRTAEEGFSRGTVIFLDIERMDAVPQSMRGYYKAWTAGVLADGRFRPGYYTHDHNAETVYRDVSQVFVAGAVTTPPQFWIASGRGFSEEKQPVDVGHSFASVWQGLLDVVQTHNGVKLPIDVNIASGPSPSSYEYAAE